MDENLRSEIIERYRSSSPEVDTSQSIVKAIAEDLALKEAAVRSILVREGIYVKKIKWRVWDLKEDEKQYIRFKLGNFGTVENRDEMVEEISQKFYIKDYGVKMFAEKENVWPLSDDERRQKEERDARWLAERELRDAEREKELLNDPEYQEILKRTRETEKNLEDSMKRVRQIQRQQFVGDAKTSFIGLIVLIFLVALVQTAFSGVDDRTDSEIALDSYCASQGRSGCSDTARELDKMMDR